MAQRNQEKEMATVTTVATPEFGSNGRQRLPHEIIGKMVRGGEGGDSDLCSPSSEQISLLDQITIVDGILDNLQDAIDLFGSSREDLIDYSMRDKIEKALNRAFDAVNEELVALEDSVGSRF